MIEQLKIIECEFNGLISHQIVANRLFDDNEEKAIKYLDFLVDNGSMKYLNGEYPENQYYKLNNNNYKPNCNLCNIDGCIEPLTDK